MSALKTTASLAAVATIALGAGVAGTALFRDPATTSHAVARSLRTPVLSVRRFPTLLHDSLSAKALTATISQEFERVELGGAQDRSCIAAEITEPASKGRQIVDFSSTRSVIPASTLKVITANAALSMLDPNTKFVTSVRATSAPSNGTLSGNLWIIGGGDPLLETATYTATRRHQPNVATSLDALADNVVAAGITHVTGSVIGDDRYFDDVRVVPSWKTAYVTQGEVGPMGGLLIDDNFTRLDAKNRPIAATNVPLNAAEAFLRLLEARGVVVDGGAGAPARTDPPAEVVASTPIASAESIPLTGVLAEMLSESDNTTAEAMVKHISRASGGTGSTSPGVAVISGSLTRQGVDTTAKQALHMVDGSGLDRSDRASCALLVEVLRSGPLAGDLVGGFPVMGQSGTLRERLKNTAAAGHVRAKTGTLNGVSALTGIADVNDGRFIRFAMVLNGLSSTGYGVALGDKLSSEFVNFGTLALDPSALGPLDATAGS